MDDGRLFFLLRLQRGLATMHIYTQIPQQREGVHVHVHASLREVHQTQPMHRGPAGRVLVFGCT